MVRFLLLPFHFLKSLQTFPKYTFRWHSRTQDRSRHSIKTLNMISETTPYFSNNGHGFQIYEGTEEMLSSSTAGASSLDTFSSTLLYNLSILKDKVKQARTLVSAVFSEDHIPQESKAMAITGMGSLTQDIIGAASSMMPAFQQLNPQATVPSRSTCELPRHHMKAFCDGSLQPSAQAMDHVLALEEGRTSMPSGGSHYFSNTGDLIISVTTGDKQHDRSKDHMMVGSKELPDFSSTACDILELDAADLLAKYTHYCQVCGKGFKRGANLRMHMRAHGDEYKTNKALSNPMKDSGGGAMDRRRYSCPEKGCRWNKRHPKFQPLKSLLCVKNHYRRSHCPKMYVCSRCNCKQFSVLSDLRTHEQHCGDLKWQCSCGTTFSRKDKLMGHLSLFAGHAPAPSCFEKGGELQIF